MEAHAAPQAEEAAPDGSASLGSADSSSDDSSSGSDTEEEEHGAEEEEGEDSPPGMRTPSQQEAMQALAKLVASL